MAVPLTIDCPLARQQSVNVSTPTTIPGAGQSLTTASFPMAGYAKTDIQPLRPAVPHQSAAGSVPTTARFREASQVSFSPGARTMGARTCVEREGQLRVELGRCRDARKRIQGGPLMEY